MAGNGDDLSLPREIDFSVIFPTLDAASYYSEIWKKKGCATRVGRFDDVDDLPFDVTVIRHMIPSHSDIAALEAELEITAEPLGGRNDGWGCFSQGELNTA